MTKRLPDPKKLASNASAKDGGTKNVSSQEEAVRPEKTISEMLKEKYATLPSRNSDDVAVIAQVQRKNDAQQQQQQQQQVEQKQREDELANSEDSIWRILARQANLEEVIERRVQEKQAAAKPVVKPAAADQTTNPDILKFGNYCLVILDALLWIEEENQTPHICQIAATMPQLGGDFVTYIHPEIKVRPDNYPFRHVKNRHWLLDLQKTSAAKLTLNKLRPAENPLKMYHALENFLKYLQEACQVIFQFLAIYSNENKSGQFCQNRFKSMSNTK